MKVNRLGRKKLNRVICGWCDCLCRKSQRINEKAPRVDK